VQTVLRPAFFRAVHRSAGHLHFFSRETALLALEEAGYEVIDSTFTSAAADFRPTSLLMALAWLPRKLLMALSPTLASRLLGGLSLLVLARPDRSPEGPLSTAVPRDVGSWAHGSSR